MIGPGRSAALPHLVDAIRSRRVGHGFLENGEEGLDVAAAAQVALVR